jgi:hypothetical protein
MTFQGCFLPSFDSFGKAVSEKKKDKILTHYPNGEMSKYFSQKLQI